MVISSMHSLVHVWHCMVWSMHTWHAILHPAQILHEDSVTSSCADSLHTAWTIMNILLCLQHTNCMNTQEHPPVRTAHKLHEHSGTSSCAYSIQTAWTGTKQLMYTHRHGTQCNQSRRSWTWCPTIPERGEPMLLHSIMTCEHLFPTLGHQVPPAHGIVVCEKFVAKFETMRFFIPERGGPMCARCLVAGRFVNRWLCHASWQQCKLCSKQWVMREYTGCKHPNNPGCQKKGHFVDKRRWLPERGGPMCACCLVAGRFVPCFMTAMHILLKAVNYARVHWLQTNTNNTGCQKKGHIDVKWRWMLKQVTWHRQQNMPSSFRCFWRWLCHASRILATRTVATVHATNNVQTKKPELLWRSCLCQANSDVLRDSSAMLLG